MTFTPAGVSPPRPHPGDDAITSTALKPAPAAVPALAARADDTGCLFGRKRAGSGAPPSGIGGILGQGGAMLLLAAAVLLAGCGGGGGGGGLVAPDVSAPRPQPAPPATPAPLPQPAPPPPMAIGGCVETADFGCLSNTAYLQRREIIASRHRDDELYWNQWGLETIGADKAWADVELLRGAGTPPGTGVTVGFIDTGIDQGHPLLAGKSIPETFLEGAVDEDGSFPSHGTGVASVVGATPGARCSFRHVESNACVDFRGVAPGANLKMFAVPLEGGRPPDQIILPTTPGELADDDAGDAALYGRVLLPSEHLDVLNLSFGLDGLIEHYTEAQLRAGYGGAMCSAGAGGRLPEDPSRPGRASKKPEHALFAAWRTRW